MRERVCVCVCEREREREIETHKARPGVTHHDTMRLQYEKKGPEIRDCVEVLAAAEWSSTQSIHKEEIDETCTRG